MNIYSTSAYIHIFLIYGTDVSNVKIYEYSN